MINTLTWIRTGNTYPYRNLAIEEYLTMHTREEEIILYLWQNQKTVVIGKNQNCWKECNVNFLEEDGGHLVRRLSGGGAVYHDLGNLNFTFCVRKDNYNLDKQLEVILAAVRSLGIHAQKTGRNDITVDGRKFSGNAFLKAGDHYYHHGTLMLNVNGDDLTRYLNVDKKKLASKGVDSVRSRVASLSEFCPDISVDQMADALILAFSEVYGCDATELKEDQLPEAEIRSLQDRFQSWDWKYGQKIPFENELAERFDWGDVQIQIHVNEGIVRELNFFSDAMDQDVIDHFREALLGCRYETAALTRAISHASIPADLIPEELLQRMKKNITDLIREKI